MAGIQSSSYYNDPALGQAFSNLANLFAPPSGSDAAGYATAEAKKAETQRLADLFDYAKNPNFNQAQFDRMGVASGTYTPIQSYYAVDTGDATARRGQDITAATSLANNRNSTMGSTIASLYGPLSEGQVRSDVPADVAGLVGLPAIAAAQGNPKPLSETEWMAAQKARLAAIGQLTDQNLMDLIYGGETPVKVAQPDGSGVYMAPGQAARTGAAVYDPAGAASDAADNYLAVGPDGKELRFVGYVGPDGKIRDRATGEVVPNVVRKEGTGGGMSLEVGKDGNIKFVTGSGTNTVSRTTDLQTQVGENERGAQELVALFDTLRQDDLGLLGNFNEKVLTDFGGQFNPDLARPDVVARRNQLKSASANLAKAIMQDPRLSDTDRALARDIAVGDGIDVSLPGAQAQIAQLAVMLMWQEAAARAQLDGSPIPPRDANFVGGLVDQGKLPAYIAKIYQDTMGAAQGGGASPLGNLPSQTDSPSPGPVSPAPAAAAAAAPVRVNTPDEAYALPPGTLFLTPDGKLKRRP